MKICVVCRNPLIAKTFDGEGNEVKILCLTDLKSAVYPHYDTPQQVIDEKPDLVVFTLPGTGMIGKAFREASVRVLNSSIFHDTLQGSKAKQTLGHRTDLDSSTFVHFNSDQDKFSQSILSTPIQDGWSWYLQGKKWETDEILEAWPLFENWRTQEAYHVSPYAGAQLLEIGGFNYAPEDGEMINVTRVFSGKAFLATSFLTRFVHGEGDACILKMGEGNATLGNTWSLIEKRLVACGYGSGPISLKCIVDQFELFRPYALTSTTSECFWPALRTFVEKHYTHHEEPQSWSKFLKSLANGATFSPFLGDPTPVTYVASIQSLPRHVFSHDEQQLSFPGDKETYPFTLRISTAGELHDFQNYGKKLAYNFAQSSIQVIPKIFETLGNFEKETELKQSWQSESPLPAVLEDTLVVPQLQSACLPAPASAAISKLRRRRSQTALSPPTEVQSSHLLTELIPTSLS